ncbi:MAG: response regulator, partial [Chloroflexi bacterium]|nr:response regulator [Chloroflexota bacterium]
KVLVVDDSARMREAVKLLLGGIGDCEVVGEGANGAEALEFARARRPDLVVMDLHMPIMGGLEALRRLKGESPCTQVVLISSTLEQEVREEALRLGALACLEKGPPLWDGLPLVVSRLAAVAPIGPLSA